MSAENCPTDLPKSDITQIDGVLLRTPGPEEADEYLKRLEDYDTFKIMKEPLREWAEEEIKKCVPNFVSPYRDTAGTNTDSLQKQTLEKKLCTIYQEGTSAEILQAKETELSSLFGILLLHKDNKLHEDARVERQKEDLVKEIIMSESFTQVKPSDSNANLNAEADLPLHVDSDKKLNSGYTGSKGDFEVNDASVETPARKLRSAKVGKAELSRTGEEKYTTQTHEEHFASIRKEFKPVTNNRSTCTSSSVSILA